MPKNRSTPIQKVLSLAIGLAAAAGGFFIPYAISHGGLSSMKGLILRGSAPVMPWKSVYAEDVEKGTSIPADTHVVFQLPEVMPDLSRETLFGNQGKRIRYWGYCLPINDSQEVVAKRSGLPGLLFLSEAERAARAEAQRSKEPEGFSVTDLPTPQQLEDALHGSATSKESKIRHQLEIFSASMLCYVMTEKPLAMGIDTDGDTLNNMLEKNISSDPKMTDTDSDGLRDDIEYRTGTLPNIRDTDSDGLIDGFEDRDLDGKQDKGETSARNKDSDGDHLCDGLCRVKFKKQEYYVGEDRNLDGEVNNGETDALNRDTDGDESPDDIEFYQCLKDGGTDC